MSPRRGMLRLGSDTKITFDGNSLVYGVGATTPMPTQLMALTPLAGSGATMQNCGVSAQTFRMMNGLDGGSTADVDGSWTAGMKNILGLWEGTNSIFFGRSAAQTAQDCIDLIKARKAARPWRAVVLMTALPRFEGGKDNTIVQWNALARANYRAWGADVLVDVRAPGSPFNFDGTVAQNFLDTQSLWFETSQWVHLTDAGYAIVAKMVAAGLRRLPFRAPA